MFKLTGDEMVVEIYTVLQQKNLHGDDLNVAKKCTVAIIKAEIKKEEEWNCVLAVMKGRLKKEEKE